MGALLLLFMGGLFSLVLLFALIIPIRSHVVREGERLVIYRLGRFNRISGPGLVWVHHTVETVENQIDVRTAPRAVEARNLYFFDIPFGYTFSLWYRLDLTAATGNDHRALLELVQLSPDALHAQIQVKIRSLMDRYMVTLHKDYNMLHNAPLLEKLVPLLPGREGCEWLRASLRQDLPNALRPLGAIFHPEHDILVQAFFLSPGVVRLFNRQRAVEVLRQHHGDVDDETLMHLVSSVEHTPLESMHKITVTNGSLDLNELEYQLGNANLHVATPRYEHRNIPRDQQRAATNQRRMNPDAS